MLVTFFFIFLAGMESFIVFYLAKHGNPSLAKAIDCHVALWVPASYLLCFAYLVTRGAWFRYKIRTDRQSDEYLSEVGLEVKCVHTKEENGGSEEDGDRSGTRRRSLKRRWSTGEGGTSEEEQPGSGKKKGKAKRGSIIYYQDIMHRCASVATMDADTTDDEEDGEKVKRA